MELFDGRASERAEYESRYYGYRHSLRGGAALVLLENRIPAGDRTWPAALVNETDWGVVFDADDARLNLFVAGLGRVVGIGPLLKPGQEAQQQWLWGVALTTAIALANTAGRCPRCYAAAVPENPVCSHTYHGGRTPDPLPSRKPSR